MNQNQQQSQNLTRIGSIIAGFIALCIAGAGVVYFTNPFGVLNLFSSGSQIAEVMPEDTLMYMTVDLLNTQSADMQNILNIFDEVIEDVDLSTDKDAQNDTYSMPPELDKFLEEFDITFEEDIATWIGRHSGLGLVDIDFAALSQPTFDTNTFEPIENDFADSIKMIMAIESRDNEAADSFIEKLKTGFAKNADDDQNEMTTETHGDVTFYTLRSEEDSISMSFGRSKNLVLITLGSDGLFKDSIDLQASDANLATLPAFTQAFAPFPEKRFLSIYYNGSKYFELIDEMQDSMGGPSFDFDSLMGGHLDFMALSLTALPEGLAIDSNTNFTELTEDRAMVYKNLNDSLDSTLNLLPESTILYSAGGGIGDMYGTMLDAMAEDPNFALIEQSIDEMALTLGFHPTKELLPLLDKNFVIAAAQTGTGELSEMTGVDLNLITLFGTSDVAEMSRIAQSFAGSLGEQGFAVSTETNNGVDIYQVANAQNGNNLPVAFGVGNDYLAIGSSSTDLGQLFAGNASVIDSPKHQTSTAILPDGMTPYFYMDFRTTLAVVKEADPTMEASDPKFWSAIAPIDTIAAGQSFNDKTLNARVFIFINADYTLDNQQASSQ